MPKNNANYTLEEIDQLYRLRSEGKSFEDIAIQLGRTARAWKSKYAQLEKQKTITQPGDERIIIEDFSHKSKFLGDFTFREILAYLYKNGFRIEDNKLVRYTRSEIDPKTYLG